MSDSSSGDRILPGNMSKSASAGATLPRRRRLTRRLAACAIAVAAVALIVVSASFLFVSSGADDANGVSAGELADALVGPGAQERRSGQDAQSGQSEDAASPAGVLVGSEGAASGAGASGAANEGSVSGAGAASSAPDGASPGTGAPSSGAGSSASSGSASSSGASGTGADAPYEGTVTVTVTVSSSAVGGGVSGSARPTFAQGATAYDALCATGLSVNAETTAYGIYVTAIGGLAQKEHGGKSGWMFSVNGTVPMTSCGNYVLHDGDNVQWYYVV